MNTEKALGRNRYCGKAGIKSRSSMFLKLIPPLMLIEHG